MVLHGCTIRFFLCVGSIVMFVGWDRLHVLMFWSLVVQLYLFCETSLHVSGSLRTFRMDRNCQELPTS